MPDISPSLRFPEGVESQPIPSASTSAHRAFIYALALPGLGEMYAQAWIRGTLALSLFIGFFAWCSWLLYAWTESIFGGPAVPGGLAGSGWTASFGLYFTWLCSMLSAVYSARSLRVREGLPPQRSLGWAIAMAWLCPGAGQVYAGATLFGCVLFVGYLAANLLIIPAYEASGLAVKVLFTDAGVLSTPILILPTLTEIQLRLKYCYAALLQDGITYVAIAEATCALRSDWRRLFAEDRATTMRQTAPVASADDFILSPADDNCPDRRASVSGQPDLRARPFFRRTEGRFLGLAILGWLCPGAGQLLLGQTVLGWSLLAAFAGGRLLLGALLDAAWITPAFADALAWAPVLLRFYAMIDAPVRLVRQPESVPLD